ncbi:MAG: dihydroxyacetone kinase subunit [Actinomycetota bacterium]
MTTAMTTIDGTTAHAWLVRFTEIFGEAQQQLTDLDRLAGDGDFGTNIASALRRVEGALPAPGESTFRSVFEAVSRGFLATGGTSGPLFGMFFRELSKAGSDSASARQLADGMVAGLQTIQKLGNASVGDNTMIDALAPASEAMVEAAGAGRSPLEVLEAAASAGRVGALSTRDLVAARGRATYVGELARGVLDPGAITIALFFEAGAVAAGGPRDRTSLFT